MKQIVCTAESERRILYTPPAGGFVAWVTTFDYGDGRIGISYDELRSGKATDYFPPTLEFGEAIAAPVSYCSAECGREDICSERVYLMSEDNGKTWQETGRCVKSQAAYCNVGFPDGRILGFQVGRVNQELTGWCDYLAVRESRDGGNTWHEVNRLLEGCASYLWRVRRLKDGSFVILTCLYGTPWGTGKERMTRNTMLPDETYLSKIQTLFFHSTDGKTFTGPHYVLPGIGAHEYDMAELENGELLFVAGDVQATPTARQIVKRIPGGFINGPMLPVHLGAPEHPEKNPQGGYVPETFVCLPGNLLVGARRNKSYSCSPDLGANWYPIENMPQSLYQPVMQLLPNGMVANFGHFGGDVAEGQVEMYVGADFFRMTGEIPACRKLTLVREKSADNSHYENRYTAQLLIGNEPAAGQTVTFRVNPFWNADGSASTLTQAQAPIQKTVLTDADGKAAFALPEYDAVRDIHFAYTVDAAADMETYSPAMLILAMTPHRRCRHPYDAYFAEGILFVSPQLEQRFPEIYHQLQPLCGCDPVEIPDASLREALLKAGVLTEENGKLQWIRSTHTPRPLDNVLPMGAGDWYI